MRFGTIPENLIEWIVLAVVLAPTPLVDTQMAYTLLLLSRIVIHL